MNSRTKSHFVIVRPLNVLLGMLSIFVGAFLTGTLSPLPNVLLACISGGLIMAGGNVINDYFDIEIDRVNKPFRPLPAGQLSPRAALNLSTILFALGIFLSIFIQIFSFAVAAVTVVGLIIYSARLKRTFLWGNVAVSVFAGLAFVYGGLAVRGTKGFWIPAGFAFLFHLGREIIKGVEDREADGRVQANTLALRVGGPHALRVATGVYLFLIVRTIAPYVFHIYGEGYIWTVVFGVDLVVLLMLAAIWFDSSPPMLRRVSAILKADMFIGLIALYQGQANIS